MPSSQLITGGTASTPTMVPAKQRWKRLWSQVITNRKPLPPNLPELEKIQPVAAQTIHSLNHFTNGIDHSQVEEQTEDINVASSYSANDSDGPSTVIAPPPSDQTVLDIVEDAVGSPRNMSGDQVTLLVLNAGTNRTDHQPQEGTRNISCFWIVVSVAGLALEAVSAYFGQVATGEKLHYALYAMLLSIVAVLVCILDLIYNAVKQSEASASDMLWGILSEISGLVLACIQCITATLEYSFLRRKATYPVRVSPVSFLCSVILIAFKYRSARN